MKSVLLFFLLPLISAEIRNENYFNVENFDVSRRRYSPDWDDLDTRPLPQWYDEAKIGIFLHWGVFSVPSFGSEWFWNHWQGKYVRYTNFMEKNYPPNFTYQEFAPMFTAELFDPEEWAALFAKAGAKYIVLTTKHHEGFTLFPSKRSFSWNAVDVGPHRDLVGDLAASVRDAGIKFGVYHSLYEWYNPIYIEDRETNFTTRTYVINKLWPDLKQLINDYHPSVLWVDGDWETYDRYWHSQEFLAWMYNDSPVSDEIVTNDRWGIGCYGNHGDFYNYADRYNPGKLLAHKWENAFTVDSRSWGYRRNVKLSDVLSFDDLLYQVVSSVSCGGNALINVGPTKEGTIAPIYQERLLSLGAWLDINGEAIYASSPWLHQNDSANTDVWYTCHRAEYNAQSPTSIPVMTDSLTAIYAIVLKWPQESVLVVKDITMTLHSGNYNIELLGNPDIKIQWTIKEGRALIELPNKAVVKSSNAWVLKFTLK
ncbi:tissue alpha-L-fucosidase [Cydia strobilella]|uniref:tissue alpha-L-fucosidase n=1 Tax=Cydia strobilella TaxID=1100964 RepID=UPI003005BAE9